jgi:hypothetical protein
LEYFHSSIPEAILALTEPNIVSILAAAKDNLPSLPACNLSFDKHLGSGASVEVNCEIYDNSDDPDFTPYYIAVKHVNLRGSNVNLPTPYNSVMNELRVLINPALKDNDSILPILAYG